MCNHSSQKCSKNAPLKDTCQPTGPLIIPLRTAYGCGAYHVVFALQDSCQSWTISEKSSRTADLVKTWSGRGTVPLRTLNQGHIGHPFCWRRLQASRTRFSIPLPANHAWPWYVGSARYDDAIRCENHYIFNIVLVRLPVVKSVLDKISSAYMSVKQ